MRTGGLGGFLAWGALAALTVLPTGCGDAFEGEVLAALPVAGEPTSADWERAVPLDVTVWMGNVHEPPEIVALDGETSHRSTAQCHHGPSNSRPVRVRLAALHDGVRLVLRASWGDPTEDRSMGWWASRGGEWAMEGGGDDGIAILWGGAVEDGSFRCQSVCHLLEVDVYDGGTQRRMGMRHLGGTLDLWRWRAGATGPFGLADDMVVDGEGKRGDGGQVLPVERRAADLGPAVDGARRPQRDTVRPVGRQAEVAAEGAWSRGRWEVTFRRDLDTGDPLDVAFAPGGEYPFSLSVFDATWTEHHVADRGLRVRLVEAGRGRPAARRYGDDPTDF